MMDYFDPKTINPRKWYRIGPTCQLLKVCRNTLSAYTKKGLLIPTVKRGVKFYKGADLLKIMGETPNR